MVIEVGYFCTGGHTETGGIQAFLDKISPELRWTRCFPAAIKPGPKLGRAAPRGQHQGVTGERLKREMLQRLELYHHGERCSYDLIVLIDDADCRFADEEDELAAFRRWSDALSCEVQERTRPSVRFHALLASPEIDAWLLSDWEESFGREYKPIAARLRRHIKAKVLGPLAWEDIEQCGGHLVAGSCEHKLSERVRALFFDATFLSEIPGSVDRDRLDYRKNADGASMLKRIRPDRVGATCGRYFRPVYEALRAMSSESEGEEE